MTSGSQKSKNSTIPIKKRPSALGTQSEKIPVVSLFTGVGLLDLGFAKAGFRSVWHNECEPAFVQAFEHAMASVGVSKEESVIQNKRSIVDVGPRQILKEAFGDAGVPRPFGMIGGPPCPDFSVGGKNLGSEGERGRLSEVYAKRIVEIRPDFFLFENVPGLLRTLKHRKFLERILDMLSEHYLLDIKLLNALEFGVPQDRERVFIVGISHDFFRRHKIRKGRNLSSADLIVNARNGALSTPLLTKHWFPWYRHAKFRCPKSSYCWPTENPFGSDPGPPPKDSPLELMVGPLLRDIDSLPNARDFFTPYSSVFQRIAEGDVSRKSSKRLHRWRFSPAAAYGNNEVLLHPWLPRRLSAREALRIQTAPDDFALPEDMTLSSKFKTIGNAVPMLLAKAVADTIKSTLAEISNETFRLNS
jgi:DNA (cytosine-5)-methyltransferase 1